MKNRIEFEYELPVTKKQKKRTCLRCNKEFTSSWVGHRICRRCEEKEQDALWRTIKRSIPDNQIPNKPKHYSPKKTITERMLECLEKASAPSNKPINPL